MLSAPIKKEEVRSTMFSMDDHKAPGPNGFTVEFYKNGWSVVGVDFTYAMREFFATGYMPKAINATIISLIPKKQCPLSMRDYIPISCCNVVYKCITKLMAEKMKKVLQTVVSENQSAFMQGRLLSDNILPMQELVHNYHKMEGPKRCAFKIDIMKAYDFIKWEFLWCVM
ncbi:hypothetical protein LIER_18247 [Lithospermum erythrorhizon]|uniref:Reverse transcriptase domain-containing protein n=1 Tax=Lithospermum erythrorhizon TaxID=34254 RepID=A0AAV3QD99_LITER